MEKQWQIFTLGHIIWQYIQTHASCIQELWDIAVKQLIRYMTRLYGCATHWHTMYSAGYMGHDVALIHWDGVDTSSLEHFRCAIGAWNSSSKWKLLTALSASEELESLLLKYAILYFHSYPGLTSSGIHSFLPLSLHPTPGMSSLSSYCMSSALGLDQIC